MGIVYVLTNDAMPGIVKIGITEDSVEARIKSLDNTSLPLPFRFYFAIESKRYKEIEKLAHDTFSAFRVRENREFFKMDPERAVSALKISGDREIKLANKMIDDSGNEVNEPSVPTKRTGKRFSFASVGINVGTELSFTRNEDIKCKVIPDDKVEYEEKEYSLSGLADMLLRKLGYDWKSVQGSNFFEYNGKTLYQLKKDIEDSESEENESESET
ncbi:MAG: GIY-YIG nuclease family protein [Treponema sp.]|nr:GIY-YIG nuclease family protein [Treponema sp.]